MAQISTIPDIVDRDKSSGYAVGLASRSAKVDTGRPNLALCLVEDDGTQARDVIPRDSYLVSEAAGADFSGRDGKAVVKFASPQRRDVDEIESRHQSLLAGSTVMQWLRAGRADHQTHPEVVVPSWKHDFVGLSKVGKSNKLWPTLNFQYRRQFYTFSLQSRKFRNVRLYTTSADASQLHSKFRHILC